MNKSKCTVCSTSLEAVRWGRCFSVSLLRETEQVFFSGSVSAGFTEDVRISFQLCHIEVSTVLNSYPDFSLSFFYRKHDP